MGLRTPLFAAHQQLGGRMVPFGGWDMPLHYGSQIQEHHAVRRDAGMFDVSHMAIVDILGRDAQAYLRHLLANDVARLRQPGKALYSCMLTAHGGVIDDLIVYYFAPHRYRLVVNAATAEKDLAWMRARLQGMEVEILRRSDLAMIAVQGPNARDKCLPLLPTVMPSGAASLGRFFALESGDWVVARTGYTGEDGFEVMLPAEAAADFWRRLRDRGVNPCGLGARDTLRLEAGMNLYGQDMDEQQSPLESGLAWTIAWDPMEREFVGRGALEQQRRQGGLRRFVGLVLEGRGVMRNHQEVWSGDRLLGEVTSGGFSPTLEVSIALARLTAEAPDAVEIDIRGQRIPARVVVPPFVRNGKSCIL